MGMGDKPKPYTDSYRPVLCDVTQKLFAPCCVQECREPRVAKKYGDGLVAHVSIYVCRKCKYKVPVQFCGALGCALREEKNVH